LCECGNGSSEKYKQNCCADNSFLFHRCSLRLMSHLPLIWILEAHLLYRLCACVSVH
jgi:hypothetical protein